MAIGVAQTCMSSLGIGWQLAAHQVASFSFSVQMGEVERKMGMRDGHLYFIGLDAVMPLNCCCSSPEWGGGRQRIW